MFGVGFFVLDIELMMSRSFTAILESIAIFCVIQFSFPAPYKNNFYYCQNWQMVSISEQESLYMNLLLNSFIHDFCGRKLVNFCHLYSFNVRYLHVLMFYFYTTDFWFTLIVYKWPHWKYHCILICILNKLLSENIAIIIFIITETFIYVTF